ncbi:hypothetical protein D5S17_29235 [Pseudonocardiaceae bacterium YIM PH 21723]|nr:hypothetical protein D5S17_29235 [Pseudonocardiaceae bacterium YIM PH 21723]
MSGNRWWPVPVIALIAVALGVLAKVGDQSPELHGLVSSGGPYVLVMTLAGRLCGSAVTAVVATVPASLLFTVAYYQASVALEGVPGTDELIQKWIVAGLVVFTGALLAGYLQRSGRLIGYVGPVLVLLAEAGYLHIVDPFGSALPGGFDLAGGLVLLAAALREKLKV